MRASTGQGGTGVSGGDSIGSSYDFDGDGDDDCGEVSLEASVESPLPRENFKVGNLYRLVLNSTGPVRTIHLESAEGSVVGAVRPVPPLVRCLGRGVEFTAIVSAVKGADIRVRIATS